MFIGKRLRAYVKARGGVKKRKKLKRECDLGEEKTGFGALHVVKREEEPVMLPGVGHNSVFILA